MPTSRPRHTITETEALSQALERARPWAPPGTSASALLSELATVGTDEYIARRREAEPRRELWLRFFDRAAAGEVDLEAIRAARDRGRP